MGKQAKREVSGAGRRERSMTRNQMLTAPATYLMTEP